MSSVLDVTATMAVPAAAQAYGSYTNPDSEAVRLHMRKRLLGLENEFVVCNPTPDSYKIPWGGETLFVPPRHIAVQPHPKFSDVKHSYEISPGKYLPGTLVIRDLKEVGDLGQEIIHWSATACVRAKIGLEFTAEYGIRGVFWLPTGFTMEEFQRETAAGLVRWQDSKLEDARRIVHEVETQLAVHRERNMAPPLPPPAYDEAKAMLVAAAEKMQMAYSEIMVSRNSRSITAGAEEAASFREAREAMGLNAPTPERVARETQGAQGAPIAGAVPVPVPDRKALMRELLADREMLEELRQAIGTPGPGDVEPPLYASEVPQAPADAETITFDANTPAPPPGTVDNNPSKPPKKR